MGYIRKWTDSDLENAVKSSLTFSDVCRKLNLTVRAGNFTTIKSHCARLNIDYSHFDPRSAMIKALRRGLDKIILTEEDLLVENCKKNRRSLVLLVKNNNLLSYICAICNQEPIWNNVKLTLQLDHINGISNDNRLENLRWLCPNCHTQTITWGNKRGSK